MINLALNLSNIITNSYQRESTTMLKKIITRTTAFSFNLNFFKSDFYKFGGVALPSHAVPLQQYKPHLQKILSKETIENFLQIYNKIIHSIHNKDYELLQQLIHSQMPQFQMDQKTKFLNKQSDVNIFVGDCVFGHYTIMNNYLGYKVDCFQNKQKDIDNFAVSFDKLPYQLTYIQQKVAGIFGYNEEDHQKRKEQGQQTDILPYYLGKKFKISIQMYFESKAKLVPGRHAFKSRLQQNLQVHQMRFQLQGLLNHYQVHASQFKSVFMNDHKGLLNVTRTFAIENEDWCVVQMDHCHLKNFLLLN